MNSVVPPVPLLSEILGSTCPRQLYGAGAYAARFIAFRSANMHAISRRRRQHAIRDDSVLCPSGLIAGRGFIIRGCRRAIVVVPESRGRNDRRRQRTPRRDHVTASQPAIRRHRDRFHNISHAKRRAGWTYNKGESTTPRIGRDVQSGCRR